MAFDFDEVKETVKTIILRLDSPSSDYNLVFSESGDAVEVRVEDIREEIVFLFTVDADRFRVVKGLEIDPKGYASFTYQSCVELLSYIIEYFYPLFYRLNNHASILVLQRAASRRTVGFFVCVASINFPKLFISGARRILTYR